MTSVVKDPDDSGEYSDASQDIEHTHSGNDLGQQESDYDSQGSDSENSNEDPENKETERRVDDDEDRSNPQYIPKRGTFYEHDDRTAASGEEQTAPSAEPVAEKKEGSEAGGERRRAPRSSHATNKWSHDKFNENEQAPKSRDELVSIYGYDIRNEDAPPHARRNRKYGRGPNKYTRTWEDEEAYKRQTAAALHRKPVPTAADFPQLPSADNRTPRRVPRPRSKSQPPSNDSSENGSTLRRNASTKTPKKPPQKLNQRNNGAVKNSPKPQNNDKMPPIENLTITTTVLNNSQGQPQRKVNTSVAQQRPVPTDQGKKKPVVMATQKPTEQTQPQNNQNSQGQAQTGGEPRGGSKRYSSLRQRPLAETYTPPVPGSVPAPAPPPGLAPAPAAPPAHVPQPPPQQRYHAGDFPGGGNQPTHPQQLMHQVVSHPSPPQHGNLPQHAQQVRLGMMEQQQMVQHPHHTMHSISQPHTMGQLQPAQGYAPPPIMPTQFMQQGGNSAVFGAPAMFAQPQPYPHQMYQHHNYNNPPAGGVTYYTPEHEPPRHHRRPTSAIPIVRPQQSERPAANPTEKDNIDRIVENMFVRKPWPATHNNETKEKSSERSSQEPPSKESSQPNSLTSSSISTDSKPSELKEEKPQEVQEKDKEPETTEA